LFADASFGFDGTYLLAEVALEGAAVRAAAADGEDRLALQVFGAERVLLFKVSSLPVGRRGRTVAARTRRTVNGLLYRLR
jgi:hypothetical protein